MLKYTKVSTKVRVVWNYYRARVRADRGGMEARGERRKIDHDDADDEEDNDSSSNGRNLYTLLPITTPSKTTLFLHFRYFSKLVHFPKP